MEISVEFIRRKVFSTLHTFTDITEANEYLVLAMQKINQRLHHEHNVEHVELLKRERNTAGENPVQPFDPADLVECRIDKYSTVVIKQNHYSVPEGHVGKYIRAKVGAEDIRLFIEGGLAVKHRRNWRVHQWEMDIYHYLKTFEIKKGALNQSQCLKQAPSHIKNIYQTYYIGKEKDFIALLHYIKEKDNLPAILEAIDQLKQIRSDYISTEKIQFICEQSNGHASSIDEKDEITRQAESNLEAYQQMFYVDPERSSVV